MRIRVFPGAGDRRPRRDPGRNRASRGPVGPRVRRPLTPPSRAAAVTRPRVTFSGPPLTTPRHGSAPRRRGPGLADRASARRRRARLGPAGILRVALPQSGPSEHLRPAEPPLESVSAVAAVDEERQLFAPPVLEACQPIPAASAARRARTVRRVPVSPRSSASTPRSSPGRTSWVRFPRSVLGHHRWSLPNPVARGGISPAFA